VTLVLLQPTAHSEGTAHYRQTIEVPVLAAEWLPLVTPDVASGFKIGGRLRGANQDHQAQSDCEIGSHGSILRHQRVRRVAQHLFAIVQANEKGAVWIGEQRIRSNSAT